MHMRLHAPRRTSFIIGVIFSRNIFVSWVGQTLLLQSALLFLWFCRAILSNGHANLCLELVKRGATVSAVNTSNYTPLHWAAYKVRRDHPCRGDVAKFYSCPYKDYPV